MICDEASRSGQGCLFGVWGFFFCALAPFSRADNLTECEGSKPPQEGILGLPRLGLVGSAVWVMSNRCAGDFLALVLSAVRCADGLEEGGQRATKS